MPDGAVDADDLTYMHQYDGGWRIIATYRATTKNVSGELFPYANDASPERVLTYDAGRAHGSLRAADRTNGWHDA